MQKAQIRAVYTDRMRGHRITVGEHVCQTLQGLRADPPPDRVVHSVDAAHWFCGLGPELGWGAVGGFAVAGALDALVLHGKSSTWTPTLVPSEDGARVGVAATF